MVSSSSVKAHIMTTDDEIQVGTTVFMSHSVSSLLNYIMGLARETDARRSDRAFSEDFELFNQGRRHVCALIDLTTNVLHWYRYSVDGNMSSDPSVSDVPITISLSQLLDTLGLGSIETRPRCQQATGYPFYRSARSLGIDFLLEQTGNLIRFILTGVLSFLQTRNILQSW